LRVRLQIGLSHPHPVNPEQWLDEVNTSTRLWRKFHNTSKVTQQWMQSQPYESCSQSVILSPSSWTTVMSCHDLYEVNIYVHHIWFRGKMEARWPESNVEAVQEYRKP
jgi:hypothetical protein